MIDIHSHVLPYVDDGADDIAQAIEMLEIASQGSTKGIVLTPHSNLYEYDKNLLFELEYVFDAFKKKVEKEELPIKIFLGGEVFAGDDILEYAEKHTLPTINNSRFMLIEFDFFETIQRIENIVSTLSELGYVPIVAHPERYECIKKFPSLSLEIMNNGGLLQLNKGSITGEFGFSTKETAYELINHKTVQFVASDAHSTDFRNTDMEAAFNIVSDDFGETTANNLFCKYPQSVINNERFAISRPIAF